MGASQGRFIVFEGLDGSGKSTQVRYLARRLQRQRVRVYETFEPTDSPIGALIHQIMVGRIHCDHKTIAALFVADRIDHLLNEVNGIYHKVTNGTIVVSDRYYFSSYAYHGVHLPIEWIVQANSLAADVLRPDVNIFLDVPPDECVARLNREKWHLELYENSDMLHRVRQKYLESFAMLKDRERVLVVKADDDPEKVADEVWSGIKDIVGP